MKNLYWLIILGVWGSATVLAQRTPFRTCGAAQVGTYIKVEWQSDVETGINHYAVYRSTEQTGSFSDCIQDNIRCKGDNQSYSIEDTRDLFKTAGKSFYYKIKAIDGSGAVIAETDPVFTYFSSTSSTAKRTWGSIKAMFR